MSAHVLTTLLLLLAPRVPCLTCGHRPGWFPCNDTGGVACVAPAQVSSHVFLTINLCLLAFKYHKTYIRSVCYSGPDIPAIPRQVCDGRPDCAGGGDEAAATCATWRCEVGVRCATGGACIRVPHRHVCRPGRRPRCGDGSDQAHCSHSLYTGCFVTTELGPRIAR